LVFEGEREREGVKEGVVEGERVVVEVAESDRALAEAVRVFCEEEVGECEEVCVPVKKEEEVEVKEDVVDGVGREVRVRGGEGDVEPVGLPVSVTAAVTLPREEGVIRAATATAAARSPREVVALWVTVGVGVIKALVGVKVREEEEEGVRV